MERRGFFALVAAALAVPFRKAAGYDPTVAERGTKGDCLARVYRQGDGGHFWEIDRRDVRAGDRVIMLGLDGKRLWRAEAFTVGEQPYYLDGDGNTCCEITDQDPQCLVPHQYDPDNRTSEG